MKIVICSIYHISSEFGGGNEQHAHNLALGLVNKGHEVIYFTTGAKDLKKYPYRIINGKTVNFLAKVIWIRNWQKEISKLNFDIYHTFGSGIPLAFCAFKIKLFKKARTFLTFQAPSNPKSFIFKMASYLEEFLFRKCFDFITTTSKENEIMLKNKWPDKNIKFIPLALSSHIKKKTGTRNECRKRLNLPRNRNIVLFVGKLSSHQYYKGVDILQKTAKLLSENYLILIIGNGNKEIYYRQMAEKMKLKNKVMFLSFVENKDLAFYYKSADVFVLPSTSNSEGFGLSLIEAMYQEVPTITTKVIGSAEWFWQKAGTEIIEENNPEALASAIVKVVERENKDIIKKAKKFAESFTIERMTEKTVELYEDLASTNL